MTFITLDINPGVVKDITEYSAGTPSAWWVDAVNVRFFNDYPQKIGGWTEEMVFALDSAGLPTDIPVRLKGIPRAVNYWTDINAGGAQLFVGSSDHLFMISDNRLNDITPLIAEDIAGTLTFSPYNPAGDPNTNSAMFLTTVPSQVRATGDWVRIKGLAEGMGFPRDDEFYENYYGFELAQTATEGEYRLIGTEEVVAPTSTQKACTADFLIGNEEGLGYDDYARALGWGVGPWLADAVDPASDKRAWSEPYDGSEGATLVIEPSSWSLLNWDTNLLASTKGGTFFFFEPSGDDSRAQRVDKMEGANDVPKRVKFSSVTVPDQHVVAGGVNPLGDDSFIDPMLVRWSSLQSFLDWTPTESNTAGDKRLEIGARIVTMFPTRGTTLIATDEAIYGMTFIGGSSAFAFNLLGVNCGALSQFSMINVDDEVYWISKDNFYVFNGAVRVLQCPLKEWLFDRIDFTNSEKIFAGNNRKYNEVFWFYAEAGEIEPSKFVIYNYLSDSWSTGDIQDSDRTVWFDSFSSRDQPFGMSSTGALYIHESGTDADGEPLRSSCTTAPLDLAATEETGQGEAIAYVERIIPDIERQTGDIQFSIDVFDYPQGEPRSTKNFTYSPNAGKISTRIRGRALKLTLSSEVIGGNWRMGRMRINVQPDGMRM